MEFRTTSIYEKNAEAWLGGKRRSLNEGGTSSSKTYSILQLLILIARHAQSPFLVSVVSESLPHLKRGAMRDFFTILGESQDSNPRYNKSDHIYDFSHDRVPSFLEFFPADDAAKLRGGRRKILFLNECNNVSYDSYRELDIRTELFAFMDWNPVSEFWAHERGLISSPENAYIHSTYLDAVKVLPPKVVCNIESNRLTDPNWWNVYGLGKLGKVEGLVYPRFEQVDELPKGDAFYGLDFGFSNDPTVLLANVLKGRDLYSHQLIYQVGLTNQDISERMAAAGLRKGYDEIWADSAEPKSIEELHRLGWNVKPAVKGEGSVEYGHQKIRQLEQHWTKSSVDCIKEQRNFRYIPDKDGKLTEKTTHNFSHGMDARRYGVLGKQDYTELLVA